MIFLILVVLFHLCELYTDEEGERKGGQVSSLLFSFSPSLSFSFSVFNLMMMTRCSHQIECMHHKFKDSEIEKEKEEETEIDRERERERERQTCIISHIN